MSPKTIFSALFKILIARAGDGWAAFALTKLAELILPLLGDLTGNPVVGAAPQELKAQVQKWLEELIAKMEGRPFVQFALRRLVAAFTDDVLDSLWDRLFPSPEARVFSMPTDEMTVAAMAEVDAIFA